MDDDPVTAVLRSVRGAWITLGSRERTRADERGRGRSTTSSWSDPASPPGSWSAWTPTRTCWRQGRAR